MYMYNWITLLYRRKQHNIVNQLYSNFKRFFLSRALQLQGFSGGTSGKESTCQCRRPEFSPWMGKIPWGRKYQPSPIFLPGEFLVQESLDRYSSWCHKSVRHNWRNLAWKHQLLNSNTESVTSTLLPNAHFWEIPSLSLEPFLPENLKEVHMVSRLLWSAIPYFPLCSL